MCSLDTHLSERDHRFQTKLGKPKVRASAFVFLCLCPTGKDHCLPSHETRTRIAQVRCLFLENQSSSIVLLVNELKRDQTVCIVRAPIECQRRTAQLQEQQSEQHMTSVFVAFRATQSPQLCSRHRLTLIFVLITSADDSIKIQTDSQVSV